VPTDTARATADAFRALAQERRALAEWESRILQTQIEVSQIPAPTGAEDERAEWVTRRFRALGLRAGRDDAGNVVARAPGAPALAPVVVCAHLDTVFPAGTDVAVVRDGHRVVGPGICDNGRGLAAMIAMAAAMQRCRTPFATAVEFVATTGEEGAGDLRGAKHYFTGAPRPVATIVLDGAGDERIVNTALGARRFRIAYHGPGGHSWTAFGAVNPVHAAARAASALADLTRPARATLTVSQIGGGLSVNSIPERAWLEVDARSTSEASLARLEREIVRIAGWAAMTENERRAGATPALTYGVERIGRRAGGETSPDQPLVVAAIEATRLVGRAPELAVASTDANAAIAAGSPAVAIGAGGRGGDAHSSREWFDNAGATAGVERALTIVATMARLAAD
jgi:acetylornithine deacetylase/succinyl-diaminopimelate desuccinylase-like protein